MLLSFTKIKKLPVYTQNKNYLGKVVDLKIRTDAHSIEKYFIATKKFFITSQTFMVAPEQIIEINDEKIIVADAVVNEPVEEKTDAPLVAEKATTLNAKRGN